MKNITTQIEEVQNYFIEQIKNLLFTVEKLNISTDSIVAYIKIDGYNFYLHHMEEYKSLSIMNLSDQIIELPKVYFSQVEINLILPLIYKKIESEKLAKIEALKLELANLETEKLELN